jgi:hypothetical protein
LALNVDSDVGSDAEPGPPVRTLARRLSANWPSSLLETSAITPRPNCATLPVMFRSVSILTTVPASSGSSVAVIDADALP